MIADGLGFVRDARRVRSELGQAHRFEHVVRVARFAERLAFAHGQDALKARLAGLYHDLARLYSGPELLDMCIRRELPIDEFEQANPIVLHARLGAELARERYGVTDEAVLSAIRKHTVGAGKMNRLDVIVYLADGLEPGRSYPERARYAELARRDLDTAMQHVLGATIAYLHSRNMAVAPQTWAAARTFAVPALAGISGKTPEAGV